MKSKRILFYALLAISFAVVAIGFYLGTMHGLTSTSAKFIAVGRWTGIVATFAILLEILLMSRAPYIEKNFDLDELTQLHRLNGFVIIFAIIAHIVFITYGYALQTSASLISQFINLNTGFEDVLNASIGTVVFFIVTITSLKYLRKKMPYEIWFFTHLLVYGAVLLTFLHQVNTGFDLVTQDWLKYYWVLLYGFVFGVVAWYRFSRPAFYVFKYDFKVFKVVQESASIYSIYLTGKDIDKFNFEPGQYASFRFLSLKLWHEAHPFSFSLEPYNDYLRLSFKKISGDFTNLMTDLQPGTRVILDGPRGAFAVSKSDTEIVFLIAGGIGVAPFRAMIPKFINAGKKVVLIYSAETVAEMAFYSYFNKLNDEQKISFVAYDTSKYGYLNTSALQKIYGEMVSKSNTYICGPELMTTAVKNSLNEMGVPSKTIHTEEFKF